MRETPAHQQFVSQLDAAAAQVRVAIEGLTDEQASRPAEDGWSVKDQLTHLTLWHEMRFFEISRVARGGRAGFPQTTEEGVKHLNEQNASNRRNLSLEQVVADLDFAREMVRQAVLAAPEDRLDQSLYEEIGIEGGAAHELEHAGLIT
ncbi:MAG TPA: DinB family protein, partial [Dehalococcoidia bacterium]|nr:DinB family protein [Dehalococcoidia bacterium]